MATSSSRPSSSTPIEKMKVVREEIFGPVVTAIPFSDIDELLPRPTTAIYGLAAGVWTSDIRKAHRIASKLRAGTVWINCYNVFDAALPFGGYKQSGWGREMGHEVLEHYTEVKADLRRDLGWGRWPSAQRKRPVVLTIPVFSGLVLLAFRPASASLLNEKGWMSRLRLIQPLFLPRHPALPRG